MTTVAITPTPVSNDTPTSQRSQAATHWFLSGTQLWHAFIIAGSLFVLPICAMTYFVIMDLFDTAEFAEKERLGIEYMRPLIDLEKTVQQYGSSASAEATDAPAPEEWIGKVDRAMEAVSAVDKRLGAALRVADVWELTNMRWRKLKTELPKLDGQEGEAVVNAFADQIAAMIQDVADNSNLTLDPAVDTYYLMDAVTQKIPRAMRHVAKTRDLGAAVAAQGTPRVEDLVKLGAAASAVSVSDAELQASVKRATEANVPLQGSVGPKANAAKLALSDAVSLANEGAGISEALGLVLWSQSAVAAAPQDAAAPGATEAAAAEATQAAPDEHNPVQVTELALSSLQGLAHASATALDELLVARITDTKVTLWMRLVLASGFCFLAIGALRVLGRAQVIAAQERDQEAQRVAVENRRNQQAILQLMDELAEVSSGNLAARATVSAEITGAIADSINVTIEELRSVVKGIDTASVRVNASTERGRAIANALAAAALDQSDKIKHAAASVRSIAQSIAEVSDTAASSAEVADQALGAAGQGADAVRSAIANMDEIRAQIQETAKRIKRLGESSQEIGEIVNLIDDITEQTNVLALNAAIQAAAAGEAGRGFSIVAEEVQRLAERSANATKEISARVRTIQTDTQDAVIAMERSTDQVVEGTKLSVTVNRALSEIQSVSRQLAELVRSISVATKTQTAIAEQVSGGMTEILDITETTTAGASQISASVTQLTEIARDLRGSVTRFRL